MATQTLQTRMGLDVSQYVSAAQQQIQAMGGQAQGIEAVISVAEKFNRKTGQTQTVVKALTRDMKELTLVTEKFNAAQLKAANAPPPVKTATLTARADKTPLITPENQAKSLTAAEQIRALYPVPPASSVAELAKYESALSRVQKLIATGKITGQRFDEIFRALKSGSSLSNLNLSGDELKMVKALGQISTGFKTATEHAQAFHLGARNAFRITEALLLKEVISTLVFQLQRAIVESVQFQIRLSEIRTLSTENQASFEAWSGSIERVSNALGLPQIEVAKAAYEALSAQIVSGREQTESFIVSAGNLARIGVSSIGDSVKVLQAAFNSYNISVERADEVSAKFFVAVDRGNFTVNDLAGNFGRVSTSAAATGIRLEEVLAAMTTLTRQGVTSADAQTQLLNVFLKLQNPTQATTKFLKSMGFETGQAAVQALGFIGLLKEIEKATQGDIAALADFGGELRAIRGLIGLTTRGKGGEFERDLAEIENDAQKRFRQARTIRGESDGDQLTIELTKVKNFFTNEFGQSTLRTLNAVTKEFGGLNNVIQAGTNGLLLMAKVWGTYFVATKTAAATQVIFNTTMAGTNIALNNLGSSFEVNKKAAETFASALKVIGAVAVFSVALDELAKFRRELDETNKKSEEYENTLKRIKSLREGKTETGESVGHKLFTQSALDQSTAFSGFIDKLFQPLLQKEAETARQANKTLEVVREEGKTTALELTEAFKRAGDSVDSLIKRYRDGFRRADQAVLQSKRVVVGMKETVESLIFDLKFEFADSTQKFILREQEIQRMTSEAERLLSSNKQEDIDKGTQISVDILRKVKEDARERVQAEVEAIRAERERQFNITGRRFADNSPIFAQTDAQQERIRQFGEFFTRLQEDVQRRKEREKNTNDELARQEEDRIRQLQKRIELFNALKPADEGGAIKPEFRDPTTGKFEPTRFNKEFEERTKAVTERLKTEEEKALVLPQLERARLNLLKQQTAELKIQEISTKQLQLGNIRQTIKEEFEKATRDRIGASQATESAGAELKVASEIARGFIDRARSDQKFSTIGEGENRVVRFGQQLSALVDDANGRIQRQLGREPIPASERDRITRDNQGLIKGILETQDEIERERKKLLERGKEGDLVGTDRSRDNIRTLSESLIAKLNLFVGQFTGQQDNRNFAPPGGATLGELQQQITSALDQFNKAGQAETQAVQTQKNLEQQLSKIFTPAQIAAAKQTVASNNLTGATIRAATATENLIRTYQNMPALAPPAPPANIPVMPAGPGFHTGGLIKGPKGYDNLMIRAEAGEFVMSQDATKKWLPQLIAMNNGRSPKIAGKYHEGGLVQTNVGDVNVTITGPVSPEKNIKQIGKALRREIRRGNLDLKPRK